MSALRTRPPEGAGGKGGSVRQTLHLARELFRKNGASVALRLAGLTQ